VSWKTVPLSDLIDLQNGYAFKSSEYADSGYFLMRITNVQEGYISNHNPRYVSIPDGSKLKQFIVNEGDILMSLTGDVGRVGVITKHNLPAALNQRVARVIIKSEDDVSKRYIFSLLNSEAIRNKIENLGHGAAQLNVSTKDIGSIKVPLPPLPIQQKIVAKLDAIFAEIDRATAAAEANAKNAEALFQSYLSNIQAPLSDLGSLVTIKTGKLDSNAAVENGQYPFFTCSREIFSINEFAFDSEAVLLAGNNASGDFNVKHYKGKFNAYQRTYVITINVINKLTYRYLYYQLFNALKQFKQMSVGAGTKFLKIGMIKELKFPLPVMEDQVEILRKLECIEENKNLLLKNYSKKLTLTNFLKQSILQQAFNGELVKD